MGMKKSFLITITIAFATFFNCYDIANAGEDVCDLANLMDDSGVSFNLERHRGERIYGVGLLKDVENIKSDPCTYYIRIRCEDSENPYVVVYLDARYDRMRKVGSQVSFEGKLYDSGGWKEFVGSREPYLELILGNGRVSWAD
jgi:hypothetical protein